jgi:hypothetical protein
MRFIPAFCAYAKQSSVPPQDEQYVVGEVIFINRNRGKQYFLVEYDLNGTKLREGFCFADVGKAVHPLE